MSQENVNATPTKDLFIDMLTKDFTLLKAIPELVDNSFDGALRTRAKGTWRGLWIKIRYDENKFEIVDNCGGISISTATKYAFRFGRDASEKREAGLIGQYGVGMKRALFKLGKKFLIESSTKRENWQLEVDVDKWRTETGDWHFTLQSQKTGKLTEPGTRILVTKLYDTSAQNFSSELFFNDLVEVLQNRCRQHGSRGLQVYVNDELLVFEPITILESDDLTSFVNTKTYTKDGKKLVAKIVAGIGKDKEPAEAGWSIFCNGTMILHADKSKVTGWASSKDEEGEKNPKAHPQFSRFRGYVFLSSSDPSLLPVNTMKTGMDEDSLIYRNIRQMMSQALRKVVDLLNEYKEEKETKKTGGHYDLLLRSAKEVKITDVMNRKRSDFTYRRPKKRTKSPELANIQYQMPREKIERAMRQLRVHTNGEVGERTFEYYYKLECKDE